MTKTRLEALSDGVIAIVMTILILELKVPKIESAEGDWGLVKDFIHNLPVVLSYIIRKMDNASKQTLSHSP
ncbi:TMEM175 family protein [Paenibacillus sp. Soil724D2]|uniref:TMEM175 family protein n=1 Tax=Paenibacillus sp. (strain Soil724D2) TaxID=1736392 RepID=UPI0007160E67|nr:TMEM175 family protein [Paenibacillus sp. Soil724D2]KRE48951.1 hypothetical protein ASG85_25945 [Paenibacillus sp. Soil724D2]